jgi:alkylation response protein AidB-like acyl-CoA dehydrogenase
MDAEERELLGKSLAQVTARHTGASLDAALHDLGWADAHAADPEMAVSTLFELQGSANATSSALDHVLAVALGLATGLGDDAVSVVLPPLGSCDPPGRVYGGNVTVAGLGVHAVVERDWAMVVGERAAAVLPTGTLGLRPVQGLDPRLGLVEVAATTAWPDAESSCVPWPEAVAAGQRALAHELVGASRAMLDLARAHALERIQFGRPIATFQAVRHRLAESLVAIEAADAALAAAWDDRSVFAAGVAKALAGRGARTVARHSQQVLAGIGFTTEHPLHRYVRRVHVLDRLLGDARSLTRRLGDDLLARRSLPSVVPL